VESAAGMKTALKRLQRELESRTLEPTASSRAARRNLRAVWIGVALMLAVFVGVLGWILTGQRTHRPQLVSHLTTVAVLPFQNASADNSLDYLAMALPDEAVTTLSYAPTLSVRPFSMSQQFAGSNVDPHRVGEQLRVAEVVTGHFFRQGNRLGVTLEGVAVVKDEVAWRSSFDVPANDMLALRQLGGILFLDSSALGTGESKLTDCAGQAVRYAAQVPYQAPSPAIRFGRFCGVSGKGGGYARNRGATG